MAFVDAYLGELARAGGDLTLELRLPLKEFVGGLAIQKDVAVRISHVRSEGPTGERVLAIDWKPKDGGPFPTFRGTIGAAATGGDRCVLSIAGAYTPPGGVPGAIFDAALGVRIARATLSELLRKLAEAIEADYRLRLAL